MREIHQRIAALISAVLVVFVGNMARGGEVMGRKSSSESTPRVYTSKSGRRYARTSDVLCSASARAEIHRFATLSKERKAGKLSDKAVTTADRKK